jgi:phosphoglycolate phosphatase (TIGR01487 family)
MVRALAVDVDGTLSDDQRRLSLEAVAALRRVQDSGVQVMLASGNVLPIAYALSNYLGFVGPVIAENGGIVYHAQKVWVLGDQKRPMDAYEHLRTRMDAERLFTDRWRETEVGLKRDVDLDEVKRILEGWDVEVETTGWAIHIMNRGMNKFVGVRKACEILGIAVGDVAAIGDSDNDEMMIRECGWGIAVGNAFEGTKNAASFVAAGKNGSGVIEGLHWLGLA